MASNNERLYEILLRVENRLGAMEEKLEAVHEQAKLTNGRVNKHELLLENWKGKLAVIVVVAGFAGNLFISWIKKNLGL
jgi:hypothetical protein